MQFQVIIPPKLEWIIFTVISNFIFACYLEVLNERTCIQELYYFNIYLRNKGYVIVSIVLVAVWTGCDRLRGIGLVVGYRHRTFVIRDVICRID